VSYTRPIDTRTWGDGKFRSLSQAGPNAQTLWFFLLTGRHTNQLPGLWEIGAAAAAEILGWQPGDVVTCFRELEDAGMAEADWPARVVLIPRVIDYWKPGASNIRSWPEAFDGTPESPLKARFLDVARRYCTRRDRDSEGHLDALTAAFANAHPPVDPGPAPGGHPPPQPPPDPGGQVGSLSTSESESESETRSDIALEARQAAEDLRDRMQANNPKARIPRTLDRWAKAIDRLHRIDGRSWAEISQVIAWSQQDPFWRTNILSGDKLREKFDQLWLRMQSNGSAPANGGRAARLDEASRAWAGIFKLATAWMRWHDRGREGEEPAYHDALEENTALREAWEIVGGMQALKSSAQAATRRAFIDTYVACANGGSA
jgi:hypothetical protein